MDGRIIAELILHLGRLASGDRLIAGLTPVQWAALRYFAHANRFSRIPSAFAAFHATTRGTASQVIKNLGAKGYLKQTQSQTDGRSVRLDLTDKARAIIGQDPFETLVRATDVIPLDVRGHFSDSLQRVLGRVALEKSKPSFGTCKTCEHFEDGGCDKAGLPAYLCQCLNAPLVEEELDELCINFAPRTRSQQEAPGIGGA